MKKAVDSVAHLAEKRARARAAYTQVVRYLHYRWAVFRYFHPSFAIKYLRIRPPYPLADLANLLDERDRAGDLPRAKGQQLKTAINKIETLVKQGGATLARMPTKEELDALKNGEFEGPVNVVHSEDEQDLSDEEQSESDEEQDEVPPSGKGDKRKSEKKDVPSAKKPRRYESSDEEI